MRTLKFWLNGVYECLPSNSAVKASLFFTIHDYTHKSSLLTLFLVLVNFFTWYSLNSEIYLVIYRHLVCNKFDRAFLMLNLAFVLNLSDTCEDNFSWQTWREMNLLTQDASVFFCTHLQDSWLAQNCG